MTTPLPLPAPSSASATHARADDSDSSIDWDSSSFCSSSSGSGSSCSTGSSSPESCRTTGLNLAGLSLSANNTDGDALARRQSRKSKGEGRTSKKEKRKSHNTVATSLFAVTRSNSAANDWEGEGDAEQQRHGQEGGGKGRMGVSAPNTPRRGLSPPRVSGEKQGEGRKRSLTDVLGAGAGEVEEGLSSWINASPSPFEATQPPSPSTRSAPNSPFSRLPLGLPSSSTTTTTTTTTKQPSNLAQSLALNQLGLPSATSLGEVEEGEMGGKGGGGKRSWGFIPGPGVEMQSERRETSETTIRPSAEGEGKEEET